MEESKEAVLVSSAYKRYGGNSVILRGLNMSVPEHSIYGLLGASGCGKTTLLSCIVGRRALDSGQIKVKVQRRTQLGYMPQEISLVGEVTIGEAFKYYGMIYGMTEEEITKRSKELMEFLQLPPFNRNIRDCSGGQQRRTSMAVTLLHSPELLILDEPTVGVDPVLSNEIWGHLMELTQEKKTTIIITTHYLEEARHSNTVGIMRNGVLLAEESPLSLIERYQVDTLEDVFLQLSIKQEDEIKTDDEYPSVVKTEIPLREDSKIFLRTRFRAQLTKNILWIFRNIGLIIFVILLPALVNVIIGSLVEKEKRGDYVGLPIGVVSEEESCQSKHVFTVRPPCYVTNDTFSCKLLEIITESYEFIHFKNHTDGVEALDSGKIQALVEIPFHYSQHILDRMNLQRFSSDETLRGSEISVSVDKTDFLRSEKTKFDLRKFITKLLKLIYKRCGYNGRLVNLPISLREIIYKTDDYSILQLYWHPLSMAILFFTNVLFSATAILEEKQSGSFERIQVAGITMLEIVSALLCIQLFIIISQNIIGFAVMYGLFNNIMNGNMFLAFLLLIFLELFGLSYGLFLAAVIEEERNVSFAGIGTQLFIFLMCGTVWPTEGIYWLLRPLSKILPFTFAVESYYDIAIRGMGFSTVYFTFIYHFIFTLVLTVISYLFFRKK